MRPFAVVTSLFHPLLSRCFPLFSVSAEMEKTLLSQELEGQSRPSLAPAREEAVSGPPPRGRPWLPGQSGNPRGRPTRALQAARIAEALIQRKVVPLTNKAIELALAGDRLLLRDCLDRLSPPRREPPVDLAFPKIKTRADRWDALIAIVDAAATGEITASQGARLTRMLIDLWQAA